MVSDRRAPGIVVKEHNPRSYVVRTEDGNFRRNRRGLVATPKGKIEEPSIADISSNNTLETEIEQKNDLDVLPSPPRRIVT